MPVEFEFCKNCEGTGTVEHEVRGRGHYRGDEIEPRWELQTCVMCDGEGRVVTDEFEDDEVEQGGEA